MDFDFLMHALVMMKCMHLNFYRNTMNGKFPKMGRVEVNQRPNMWSSIWIHVGERVYPRNR